MIMNLLSLLLGADISSTVRQDSPILFEDPLRDVKVHYEMAGSDVVFSAELPRGWSFTIKIDGDRNGIWGNGAGMAAAKRGATADHNYGVGQDGQLCAQKILASFEDDPSEVLVSSDCGGYPTKARLFVGPRNAQDRSVTTITVPAAEIFGHDADAHLQICLWDGRATDCHFTPTRPYVLKAPAVAPKP